MVVPPSGVVAQLRIRLCGGLAVERGGERLDDRLPSRQARIVFACLADRRGKPISRRSLAEALWGDNPPGARDTGLRSLLSGARRPLGPDSVRGRAEVWLELPDDVWIDVEVAERHLASAEQAFEQGPRARAQQEATLAGDLLQREFLPGCGGPWVEERRSELEERGRHARELEARAALLGGDLAHAEQLARRLIDRAPYRESAHALLMEALAAQGNVAEAVLAYDRLVCMLRDDLGTVPAPRLAGLHERLLAGSAATNGQPITPSAPPKVRPRTIGAGLAVAGAVILAVGLAAPSGGEDARAPAEPRLPMQEAVLPDKRVAFSYPQAWTFRGPLHGLGGAGDGDAFCNIFRVPGAAPAAHSPQSIVRYARSRIRAWERSAPDVSAGPVRTIRAGDRLGASAVERDRAYAAPEAGRMAFFASGPDVLRIECSAPSERFRALDRRAFRPIIQSVRTLGG